VNRTGTGTGTTSGQAGSSGRAEERAHHSGKIGANVEIGAIRAGRILQAGPGNGLHSKLKIEASMGWALARGELDNKKKSPVNRI